MIRRHITKDGYTDLMCERERAVGAGVSFERTAASVGAWERVSVSSEAAEEMKLNQGHYHSLHTQKIENMDSYEREDTSEEIANELWRLCEAEGINPKRILVVGLGNERLTPDALGPLTAKRIEPTLHLIADAPELLSALDCAEIAVMCPGVRAESGFDTTDAVEAMQKKISAELVIVIDALCAKSEERLGTTFQISDSGVFPGGGVGNPGKEISERSVGCPVISIGIPTVIDAGVFSNRFRGERLLVTPRYINLIVEGGAKIISDAVNRAFGIVR